MPKAIMVLADGRSYTAVDGCRILLCQDNVQDQQIQQALQQLASGNMQPLQSGQFKVATRFTETQGQQAWQQVQGAQQQNTPVAVVEHQNFLLATRLDPSASMALSQGQSGQQIPQSFQQQQDPYQQQSGQQSTIQGQGFAQSSQPSYQQQRPQW